MKVEQRRSHSNKIGAQPRWDEVHRDYDVRRVNIGGLLYALALLAAGWGGAPERRAPRSSRRGPMDRVLEGFETGALKRRTTGRRVQRSMRTFGKAFFRAATPTSVTLVSPSVNNQSCVSVRR